jgi:hypothetical protein
LLFSDPARGSVYGYVFDGWADDGSHYMYTGEGQVGPQQMARGNLAVRNHRTTGKALRLFRAVDRERGSKKQRYKYLGEFEVDAEQPWVPGDGPDRDGSARSVIVFRLQPVDRPLDTTVRSPTGDVAKTSTADQVPLEVDNVDVFELPPFLGRVARKQEAELVGFFVAFLQAGGHEVSRWRLRPAEVLQPLLTDVYDKTTNTLYEAKASTTRADVRMLIGQLLDYRRHIPQPNLRIAALLPNRPPDDLIELIHSVGAACVWSTGGGGFETRPAPSVFR